MPVGLSQMLGGAAFEGIPVKGSQRDRKCDYQTERCSHLVPREAKSTDGRLFVSQNRFPVLIYWFVFLQPPVLAAGGEEIGIIPVYIIHKPKRIYMTEQLAWAGGAASLAELGRWG